MTAEDNAVAAGIVLDGAPQHHRQLKARPLPRNPHQPMAELRIELLHALAPIGGSGESDAPVRVKMIDVSKRQEAMQRSINGCGNGIACKGDERVERDHLILVLDAAIAGLDGEQLLVIERGKTGAADAAQITAGPLDPEHGDRRAGDRVASGELGACVAATEVGEAKIGTKQIGAVTEQLRLIQRRGVGFIPFVFEKLEWHDLIDFLCERQRARGCGNPTVAYIQ